MTNNTFNLKYYTGVGSRDTPVLHLVVMALLARELKEKYILRSGEASGADYAFSYGSEGEGELFLPWKGFRKSPSNYYLDNISKDIVSQAREICMHPEVTPWLSKMKPPAQALHTRNIFQVLGPELNVEDKSDFIICYTKNGETTKEECTNDTGGTATAIKAGNLYSVPVYNIARKDHFNRVMKMVSKNPRFYNDAREIMWDWMKINKSITVEKDKNMKDFTVEDAKKALSVLNQYRSQSLEPSI